MGRSMICEDHFVGGLDATLKLVVVQPYVPSYRVPFFSGVAAELSGDGIRLTVASPPPSGELGSRQDDSPDQSWSVRTSGRQVTVAGVSFSYLGSRAALRQADGVVVPFAASVADTWMALCRAPRRRPVGVWGHIANYVTDPNPLDRVVEKRLIRRADHVFAYTGSGAEEARRLGVSPARITVLNNTIDTSDLAMARTDAPRDAAARFRANHNVSASSRIFGVLGALDAAKRIDLLVSVLDELWVEDPTIVVVVGGRGEHEGLLRPAIERRQVVWLGRVGTPEKVGIAAVAEALINPGRIGLVAVDALVLGLPIITASDFAHHAPEVEYLVPGRDLIVAPPEPAAFADLLLSFTRGETVGHAPRMEDMVKAFAAGVRTMLA